MKEKKNVLVFPCGTEIGLEIHSALKFARDIELYGASSTDDHGRMVYKNYINQVPYITDENFLVAINNIVKRYSIDYIFPAHDSVVLELAKNRGKINAEIITSTHKTCDICRSKSKTYEMFKLNHIIPKEYKSINEITAYPVFVKPDVGQGSQGAYKINNVAELENQILVNKDLLILEYLPGKEYTVDCFTDRNSNLKFCAMRERIRTRNGISVNSKTMELDKRVYEMAMLINGKLNLRGMWFFQVKLDKNDEYKLLEVAPRIAGTMCLYRNKGMNFPLMSIYDRMGYDINILDNDINIEVDRALINRFNIDCNFEEVYVDFDDTIIIDDKVNEFMMLFLYQCMNNKKKIYLVTKHINNIYESLEKYKISKYIFDEIISIEKSDNKIKYMPKNKKAIFIDDSFAERKAASEFNNMKCFNLDAIESLIDWRK